MKTEAELMLSLVAEPGIGGAGVVVPLPTGSCFVIDLDVLRESLAEFRRAFRGCEIFYALKANPEPHVITLLAGLDCGFEAASWGEIQLLAAHGVQPERIIYGTAVKPRTHVECAFALGIDCFAADSPEEIAMIAEAAPGARILVRVKADDSSSVFRLNRKFGAAIDQAVPLFLQAAASGLLPWGLSFNVGSQARRPKVWAESLSAAAPVIHSLSDHGITLSVINIGGGFPEAYAGDIDWPLEEIAESVFEALEELPYQPTLMAEPGRRLVAKSTSLVATVIARIERPDGPWLFLDCGVYNALFEALRCQGETRYAMSSVGTSSCSPSIQFTVAGPTGDSLDVIAEAVDLPGDMKVGDQVRFERVGAYTAALASSFNGFAPPPVRILGQT